MARRTLYSFLRLLSQTYQAWILLARGQKILFANGAGSVFERLNLLYGRTKHLEKAINSGQLPSYGTLSCLAERRWVARCRR